MTIAKFCLLVIKVRFDNFSSYLEPYKLSTEKWLKVGLFTTSTSQATHNLADWNDRFHAHLMKLSFYVMRCYGDVLLITHV